jgi:uncharacterized membrane protein
LQLVGSEEGVSAFQKILDMKGLKKAEQQVLVETFKHMTAGQGKGQAGDQDAPDGKPGASGSSGAGGSGAAAGSSGAGGSGGATNNPASATDSGNKASPATPRRSNIRKLEKLMKRFQ